MYIFLLIFLLIIFIVFDYIKDKFLLTPVKVLNFMFLIIVSLYYLQLSLWQMPLSDATLIIFIITIIGFNVSYYLVKTLRKSHKAIEKTEVFEEESVKTRNIMNIITVAFIVLFAFECIYAKGAPLLFKLMGQNSSHLDWAIPSLNGLLNSIAMTFGAYYLFKRDKKCLIYVLFAILTLSRQVIISMIVECIILRFLFKNGKKIRWGRLAIFAVAGVLLFALAGNFRSGSNMMNNIFLPKYKNIPNSIMWLYSYLEFSLNNFNYLVSMTVGGINHGISSLCAFLPRAITNLVAIKPAHELNYLVYNAFTVSTWYPEIYLDFGVIGVGIMSILLGLLGAYLYNKAASERTTRYNMLYAIYLHNIIFWFFTNMFLEISIFFQFILILLIFPKFKKKMKNTNADERNTSYYAKKIFTSYGIFFVNILSYIVSLVIPKNKKLAIITDWFGERFSDNSKYLFLQHDAKKTGIRLVWITSSDDVYNFLKEHNYEVVKKKSLYSCWLHLRAKYHIIDQSHRSLLGFLSIRAVRINLWHGIGIKRVGYFAEEAPDGMLGNFLYHNFIFLKTHFKGWFSVGRWDYQYMSCPTQFCYDEILRHVFIEKFTLPIVCSYPRNIYLRHISEGKKDYNLYTERDIEQLNVLKNAKQDGKKLVFYIPTFRKNDLRFFGTTDDKKLEKLFKIAKDSNIVFVFKMHAHDKTILEKNENCIFIDGQSDLTSYIRYADCLITDYSSVYTDYLILNRPVIFYQFDINEFLANSLGFIIDPKKYCPGNFAYNIDELINVIDKLAKGNFDDGYEKQRIKVRDAIHGSRDIYIFDKISEMGL